MTKVANRFYEKWRGRFTELVDIEASNSTLQRKGQMLALYLALLFALLLYLTVNGLYVLSTDRYPEYKFYVAQEISAFLILYVFWKLNQKGHVTLAAYSSIGFSILAPALGSDPKYLEYVMVVFSLPIGISSFVIRPSSSFLFAFLTTAAYVTSSILSGYVWEYNLTPIVALFALAFMTWAVANRLENALKKNDALVSTLRKSNIDIQDAYETTLEGWSRALEIRDRETEGHTQRVTDMVTRIATQMGFTQEQLIHIHRGALLHDIGKLGIPDEILRKPNRLNEDEMKVMQTHTQIACDLLRPIGYLRPALNIPCYHHEKWDGTGYPHGLKGNDIPLEARIFAVIDVYDALSYDRPYRKSWPRDKVLQYIESESGKHFDPAVVEVFLKEVAKDEH
jgi:response regulator RpfG family c-di-GMP phosphodiesterase